VYMFYGALQDAHLAQLGEHQWCWPGKVPWRALMLPPDLWQRRMCGAIGPACSAWAWLPHFRFQRWRQVLGPLSHSQLWEQAPPSHHPHDLCLQEPPPLLPCRDSAIRADSCLCMIACGITVLLHNHVFNDCQRHGMTCPALRSHLSSRGQMKAVST